MSTKLIVSATASTLAMTALALGAPIMNHEARNGAGPSLIEAGMPAPSSALPYLLRR